MVNWNIPGFVTTGVEIQLGSTSFGSDYTDQILAPSGSTDLGSNQFGYELWQYDFTFTVCFRSERHQLGHLVECAHRQRRQSSLLG